MTIESRRAPLVLSFPHTGTHLPQDIEARCVSPWLARRDADWWIDRLYAFARDLDATIVHTAVSRTVIDVNRDPSGASLYPGRATTDLAPMTTFDGEPLWKAGHEPDAAEISRRRAAYFAPYHDALAREIERLRGAHGTVVLYDCHSIRSVIPRLFNGELPVFNIGTNDGASCSRDLQDSVAAIAATSPFTHVVNGRFKGGYITRHYGQPNRGVHAVQMELACRGYMAEPAGAVSSTNWPTPFDADFAAPISATLRSILQTCLQFAREAT